MTDTATLRTELTALLEPVLKGDGLDLEAVELAAAGRRRLLRVIVDADGGVDLDRLADASRAVSGVLDDSDVMGVAAYTLEVSSRGVDRPLTAPRHWRRNVGRAVRVTTVDGAQVTGRILVADEDGADVGIADTDGRRVRYADVAKARIQVEFGQSAE